MKNEWNDAPIQFVDDDGKPVSIDEAAELYRRQRLAEHEESKQQGYLERQKVTLAANQPFNVREFEAETERMAAEFNAAKAVQDRKEQDRIESENGLSWMAAHPEFVPNDVNSNNITTWLKQNGLPGTVDNLERAYQAVKPILQLKPLPPKPAKLYSAEELYEMPLEKLEEITGVTEQW